MVVFEVLRLLSAVHRAGILHGDVKPSNFLLAPGNPLCPVPIPPAGAPRVAQRAARRDVSAQLVEAEAAGLTSSTVSASSGVTCSEPPQPPFCPLPLQDCTASSVCVPYAGGWLKGIDFGCRYLISRPDPILNRLSSHQFL